jgi:hypothetical protein
MAARIDSVLADPLIDVEPLDANARRGQVVHDESEPRIGLVVRQARAQTDLVCSRKRAPGRHRCSKLTVTGAKPRPIRNATATIARGATTYAAEIDRRGDIRFTQRRNIKPGRYRLTINEKPRKIVVREKNGKLLHCALQRMITTTPITIRWSRKK